MKFQSFDAIGIGLVGAVVAGMYIGGVRPLQLTYADTVSLKAELWLAKNKLEESKASENRASGIAKELHDKLLDLDIELSNIDQMNTRLAMVTRIAEGAGLTLESVRPGAEVQRERYRAVSIDLVGRVGYIQAGVFLEDLLRQFPDTGLESIRYERLKSQDSITGRLQINMVWYAAPDGSINNAD